MQGRIYWKRQYLLLDLQIEIMKCGQATLPLELKWGGGLPIFSLVTPSALSDPFFEQPDRSA